MFIATVSPTIEPEQSITTTAAYKNDSNSLPNANLHAHTTHVARHDCSNMDNGTDVVINCIKQSDWPK